MKAGTLVAALLAVSLAGCSGEGDPTGHLAVRFATPAQLASPGAPSMLAVGDTLVLSGANGTLRIDDIRVVVANVELEAVGDTIPEEVHAHLSMIDLPLDGGAVTLSTGALPLGTYDKAEFEVDNLSADGDDDQGTRQEIQAALTAMRQVYPAFPENASMVIHGRFIPAGGSAQEFTVYFDAEIEVEMDLVPPVVIPDTEWMTIQIDPALWFVNGDQVMNLAALDGVLVQFEAEIEDGFTEVEHD